MTEVEKAAKEIKDELAKLKNEIKEAKESSATPEQVKKAEKALEDYKTEADKALKGFVKSEELDKIKTQLGEAEKEISSLKEGNRNVANSTFKGAVSEALNENFEDLKSFVGEKQKGGYFKIEVKAPAEVTSGNITTATTPDNYAASNATMVTDYIRENIFVEQYLQVGSTDKPSIPYVDETAGEGDAAMVAEGGLKPLIDADYNVKYSEAKKVAGRMKASEESLYDFKWLNNKLQGTLKRKHDIARQQNILNGDGTGQNLNGIVNLATPFNASQLGTLAATFPAAPDPKAANNYDVIAAMVNAIITQSEGTFIPNVVMINNIDNLTMKLTKDGEGRYLLPPFMSASGEEIDGVRVVSQPALTSGEFIIGDFKNIQLDNVWGYTVRIGWENDDFSRNMVTMIGESRLHLYISENDKRGLIRGTFADVKTALTTV